MNLRYRVESDHAGRAALVGGGKQSVRKTKRAQVLLAADGGLGDEAIVQAVGTSSSTAYRIKRVSWSGVWTRRSRKSRVQEPSASSAARRRRC